MLVNPLYPGHLLSNINPALSFKAAIRNAVLYLDYFHPIELNSAVEPESTNRNYLKQKSQPPKETGPVFELRASEDAR